jgi:mannosyltransferase
VNEIAARTLAFTRARTRAQESQLFWAATAILTAALAAVLGWFLRAWPPHEDEALALFVGRGSFGELLSTVITERGGAPLHFVFAWLVVHLGGGLTALRAISLVFAVASIPLIALLAARLVDRAVGIVAAALAGGTWVLLFHGIYGRMYSLFLFTSLLSFFALLRALERPSPRRFAWWGLALLAMLASHPYALLVVAGQALYVLLRRRRIREACITLAAVAVLGIPFWWADVVLRDRFDVGVGGGGQQLGSPSAVLDYFWRVAGDYSVGHGAWLLPVLLLALAGAVLLARRRLESLLLSVCLLVVPAAALMFATLGRATSPESRHLIYLLPFFSTLVAVPLTAFGRVRPQLTGVVTLAAVVLLVAGELRWAHDKTPALFDGEAASETQARESAASWLATTSRPDDVLLGYEPVFLEAWERNRSFTEYALPRADPALLADALQDVPEPLGRGVWVFDASDTTNVRERQTIAFALPKPESAYEGRVYGPYLVIRSRRPLRTRAHYIVVSEDVMRVGRRLRIGDADVNLQTLRKAESRL